MASFKRSCINQMKFEEIPSRGGPYNNKVEKYP